MKEFIHIPIGFLLLGIFYYWVNYGINTGIIKVDFGLDIMMFIFTFGMWICIWVGGRSQSSGEKN